MNFLYLYLSTLINATDLKSVLFKSKKHPSNLQGANYAPDRNLKSTITKNTANEQLMVFSFPEGIANRGVLYVTSYKLWKGNKISELKMFKEGSFENMTDDFIMFSDRYPVKKRNLVVLELLSNVIRQRSGPENHFMNAFPITDNLFDRVKDAAKVDDNGVSKVPKIIDYTSYQALFNDCPNYRKEDSDGIGKKMDKTHDDAYKTMFNALQMEEVEFQLSNFGISSDNKIHVLEFIYNTNYPSSCELLAQSNPFCYDGKTFYIKDTSSFTDQSWFKMLMAIVAMAIGLIILSFALREKEEKKEEKEGEKNEEEEKEEEKEEDSIEKMGKVEEQELEGEDGILETTRIEDNE
ncbi:hypothetical protein NUSPORA_01218 [Nucleospora cyclopteri]